MEQIELRVLSSGLDTNEDEMIVEGLVNEVGNWSHTLGSVKKFREKVNKGVFEDSIRSSKRIDFLAEHKPNLLLATTENDSLELWEDEEGLKMRAKIAPTSYGKDFYTLIKHKMINHMSFGFKVIKDSWRKGTDGIYERSIDKLAIKEVSIVRNPAYPVSAIAARGIELVEDVNIPEDIDTVQDITDELEERSIDIEALKTDIVKDVLEGIKVTINELNNKNIIKEDNTETIQETVQETMKEVTQELTEDITKKVTKDVVQETTKEVTQETVEPIVFEESKELSEENNIVDNTNGIIDLLDKYKELQSLK